MNHSLRVCSIQGGFSILMAAVIMGSGCSGKKPARAYPLRVLCGSSMSAPVQELGRQFAETNNVALEYDLGGSETLLPKILAGGKADVFVCHDPFEGKIKAAGLLAGSVVMGYLEPVVAVRPGNPLGLHTVEDLARPGLKIGIGDPRFSTCGELFVKALRDRGLYDGVMKNVMLQARTHAEIANGLIVGPLDAVVVWNFVVKLYSGKLEVVPLGVAYPETRVTVLGLASSENQAGRDAFLDWCRQGPAQEAFVRHAYRRETKDKP